MMYSKDIERYNNTIIIKTLDHPACVSNFLREIRDGINKGYTDFEIFADIDRVYPNACVPIAGIIDYFRRNGIVFSYDIIWIGYTKLYRKDKVMVFFREEKEGENHDRKTNEANLQRRTEEAIG